MRHELFAMLPVPTPEKTERFATFIVNHHTWHKHLPFFPPGATFVCFPNPHAGCKVKVDGPRFSVHKLERRDPGPHAVRLSTAEYLKQYGHWDYWVDGGPNAGRDAGPWLYSLDGERELLPEEFKHAWSCRLTAFLRPCPEMLKARASALEREVQAFLGSNPTSLAAGVIDAVCRMLRRDHARMAVARYRSAAKAFLASDGSFDVWLEFMKSEARAQRQILLAKLQQIRALWAEERPDSA